MVRYILNRIIYLIPVLFIMSVIVFSFMHLIPGDPVDYILGFDATEEARASIRQELGLDKNIVIQYISWVANLLQGDFGKSVVNQKPVLDSILEKFPATLELSIAALFISVVMGLVLGSVAATYRQSVIDFTALFFALIWLSIPNFWLAILLIIVFALELPILPSMGYVSFFPNFMDAIRHLILPAFSLGAVSAGAITRLVRSEMIEQLSQDYVITAWSKGLARHVIIFKHALRNAMLPVVTFIGLQLGRFLGGAIVIETLFAWPGVGRLIIQSIYARDYPMVQGIVLFISVLFVLINLMVDISYTLLNPKIRFGNN